MPSEIKQKEINQQYILKNFCQITHDEQEFLQSFLINLEKNEKDYADHIYIFNQIRSVKNIHTLLILAEHDKRIANWCSDFKIYNHWDKLWELMSKYPTLEEASQSKIVMDTYKPLKPQPGFRSFDLIRGMWFYNFAIKLTETRTNNYEYKKIILLKKAVSYGSFHAASEFIRFKLDKVKRNNYENFKQMDLPLLFKPVYKTAKKHGTPGYLLLANTYFEIAQFCSAYNDTQTADIFYFLTLTNLKIAKIIENQCEISIWNAYYGRGIAQSNPFKIDSLSKLIEGILAYVKLEFLDRASFLANNIAREFEITPPRSVINYPTDRSTFTLMMI